MMEAFYIRKYGRPFRCVRPGGTVLSIADGTDVPLARSLNVSRLFWPVFWAMGARPHAAARPIGAEFRYWFMRAYGRQLESLNPMLESGTMRPYVDRVFPLDETSLASARAEAGKARDKVVIQMFED